MQHNEEQVKSILPALLENPVKFAEDAAIGKLVDILETISHHYYNTDTPLVPDNVFDILKDTLEKRSPNNKFLKQIGSPISKDKVQLPHFMPSLDKIKPDTNALENWLKKYKGPYVISDKLDGVSGLFIKTDKQYKLYTRGDGAFGQDISHLIPYVLKESYLQKLPKKIAIRGELIISKENFKQIEKIMKNARNTVSGLVNSKHFSVEIAKLTEFIGYAILFPELKADEQLKNLEKYNFPTVTYNVKSKLSNDELSTYLKERRTSSKYDIDGLVVLDSSKAYKQTEDNPEHGFAFKTILTDQIAEVQVVQIIWDISKDGYLVPRVKLEPVQLGGVTITYATAFNAKFVQDNKLGPGATVKLIRSGDVIPHIQEVIKPATNNKPQMPEVDYKWDENEVNIIPKDLFGSYKDLMSIKQLSFFFSTMGVKYISSGIVTKLVDSGYDDIFKILKADKNKLEKLEGIGSKLITKIFKNIDTSFKEANLARLMTASNVFGRGFGEKKLSLIVKAIPKILTTELNKNELIDKIIEIEGFDTKTATKFANKLEDFKTYYAKLSDIVDLSHLQKVKEIKVETKNNPLITGKKFVFTGFRNKPWEEIILSFGGIVSDKVNKTTNYLVYRGKDSAKYKKAGELGIKQYDEDEFLEKFKNIFS